jgi:hypothetical protein
MRERVEERNLMDPTDKENAFEGFFTVTVWAGGLTIAILATLAVFLL